MTRTLFKQPSFLLGSLTGSWFEHPASACSSVFESSRNIEGITELEETGYWGSSLGGGGIIPLAASYLHPCFLAFQGVLSNALPRLPHRGELGPSETVSQKSFPLWGCSVRDVDDSDLCWPSWHNIANTQVYSFLPFFLLPLSLLLLFSPLKKWQLNFILVCIDLRPLYIVTSFTVPFSGVNSVISSYLPPLTPSCPPPPTHDPFFLSNPLQQSCLFCWNHLMNSKQDYLLEHGLEVFMRTWTTYQWLHHWASVLSFLKQDLTRLSRRAQNWIQTILFPQPPQSLGPQSCTTVPIS